MSRRALLIACAFSSACFLDVTYNKVTATGGFCAALGDPPAPKSCTGAQNECGLGLSQFCCDAPAVPCGGFLRDFDDAEFSERTGREATLSDFRLDAYEVTVGRFRAFIDAEQGTQSNANPPQGFGGHPRYLNSGWDSTNFYPELAADEMDLREQLKCSDDRRYTWTDDPGDNENKPINCVTWYEALLFCAWDGGAASE